MKIEIAYTVKYTGGTADIDDGGLCHLMSVCIRKKG